MDHLFYLYLSLATQPCRPLAVTFVNNLIFKSALPPADLKTGLDLFSRQYAQANPVTSPSIFSTKKVVNSKLTKAGQRIRYYAHGSMSHLKAYSIKIRGSRIKVMIGPHFIVDPELGLEVVGPWPFEFALLVGGLPLSVVELPLSVGVLPLPTFAEL